MAETPLTLGVQLLRSLALHQSGPHLHLDLPTRVSVLIGHLHFQEDFVSCSIVRGLAFLTNPWVDWERHECFLNFRDAERVVFLPDATVSRLCVVSVCALALDVGWDAQLALFFSSPFNVGYFTLTFFQGHALHSGHVHLKGRPHAETDRKR